MKLVDRYKGVGWWVSMRCGASEGEKARVRLAERLKSQK